MKKWIYLLFFLSIAGIFDAGWLTFEHFSGSIPPCSTSIFVDCGKVLHSSYATPFGIPLALIGLVFYVVETITILGIASGKSFAKYLLILLTAAGFVSSLYFMYLQLVVLGAICLYCTGSAVISTLLFLLTQRVFYRARKQIIIFVFGHLYRNVLKPIFFLLRPEFVHETMTHQGELLGSLPLIKIIPKIATVEENAILYQTVAGIQFTNPIGLAAGFDYNAQLTQILPSLGFGFQTVGTITHHPYGGNPHPLLGRLPKSKSLMVNKGFKNPGALAVVQKLDNKKFEIPVGISIGKTNTLSLKTQTESIRDIIETFRTFETSTVDHSYYELNISCPNLAGSITFYPPKNLDELLTAVDKLQLKRPVFIKMPIEKPDKEVLAMLKVISKHKIVGVIFGNLQKDRSHPSLIQSEVSKFKTGNFSGKPTFERSNELISLAFKHYGKKLIIIGCGGVFSAEDAYEKIKRGATLVQLITGMIYEGPQLIADINMKLSELLRKDGFSNISKAVGSKY